MPELRRGPASIRETANGRRPEPGILCWNCRKLTPFEEDRCQSCGAAFAGGTGGAYATSRIGKSTSTPPPVEPRPSRNLADLVADLQRVQDVSSSLVARLESGPSASLFQCPSCGRFVAEDAASCTCGVRFASSEDTFPCPECDARVPSLEEECPVCGVHFQEASSRITYTCPKCGNHVAADAIRCACGVWFED